MAEKVCGDVESRSKVSFVEGEKGSSTSVLSEFCSCWIPLAMISATQTASNSGYDDK